MLEPNFNVYNKLLKYTYYFGRQTTATKKYKSTKSFMMDIKIEQFIFIAIVLTLSDSFIVKVEKIASTEYARNCDWQVFLILITSHTNKMLIQK